jgi:hypothetical protein
MPRGARPGERRGGRIKGVPNKATIAALNKRKIIDQIAKQTGTSSAVATAVLSKAAGYRKLAVEELEEVLPIIKSVVAYHQVKVMRAGPTGALEITGALDDFKEWLRLFIETCAKLAPYQSPTFKAIAVMEPQSSGKPPIPDTYGIERLDDPVAASRAYQQLMQAPRQLALPKRTGAIAPSSRSR